MWQPFIDLQLGMLSSCSCFSFLSPNVHVLTKNQAEWVHAEDSETYVLSVSTTVISPSQDVERVSLLGLTESRYEQNHICKDECVWIISKVFITYYWVSCLNHTQFGYECPTALLLAWSRRKAKKCLPMYSCVMLDPQGQCKINVCILCLCKCIALGFSPTTHSP